MGFVSDELGYAIDLGLPKPDHRPDDAHSKFQLDPEIKCESIWSGPVLRSAALLVDRREASVRDANGEWQEVGRTHPPSTACSVGSPIQSERLRCCGFVTRFAHGAYDHFRTDAEAPARLSQVGTRTPILAQDGRDLAAAL